MKRIRKIYQILRLNYFHVDIQITTSIIINIIDCILERANGAKKFKTEVPILVFPLFLSKSVCN